MVFLYKITPKLITSPAKYCMFLFLVPAKFISRLDDFKMIYDYLYNLYIIFINDAPAAVLLNYKHYFKYILISVQVQEHCACFPAEPFGI